MRFKHDKKRNDMKSVVRGNDCSLLIPVRKIVGGEKVRFPLPAATDVEVCLVNAYRRYSLAWSVDVEDDSVLRARVENALPLGTFALEVKGRLFGLAWRSNEYEQLRIVDNNAGGDAEPGETDEGEPSVMMDTAIVLMPPEKELGELIDGANAAIEKADKAKADADGAAEKANGAAERADAAAEEVVERADEATDAANTAAARAVAAAQRVEAMGVDVDAETGEIVVRGV